MIRRIKAWLGRRIFQRTSTAQHLSTGVWGENIAAKYLKRQGYKILGKRIHIGRRDEIDIVMRNKDTLIFVEVKTRASEKFMRPAAAVNHQKKRSLSRAGVRYMKRLNTKPSYFRFDIVEVIGSKEHQESPVIRHLKHAFELTGGYRFDLPSPDQSQKVDEVS